VAVSGVNFDLVIHSGNLFVIGKGYYYADRSALSAQGQTGSTPQNLAIKFPGSTAIALDYGQINVTADFTFTLSTGEVFTTHVPPLLNFFGVTSDVPITQLTVTMLPSGYALNVTKFSRGTVAPTLSLSRSVLNFAAGNSGVTSPQQIAVNFSVGGALSWTASSNQSNIMVSPPSGAGNGVFQVSVTPGPRGAVTVTATGATNSPQMVQVNIANTPPTAPFGSFDTPADNTLGVVGAIPVTGWALDNVEVTGVDILREAVAGEPAGNLIFVGNAVFVADVRTDVQKLYSTYPFSYRAGWGYQMLTNVLPNSSGSGAPGNGTYKIHAIAHNQAGGQLDLGTKTIVVNNAHAAKPFGTLDTPGRDGTVSGTDYVNFGWALTPQPAMIPITGSTITLILDGVPAGNSTYNQFRSDIASLFPGYANSMGAVGFFHIDTATLSNGVHTISWNAFDNQGRGEGLGSRYFNVSIPAEA